MKKGALTLMFKCDGFQTLNILEENLHAVR